VRGHVFRIDGQGLLKLLDGPPQQRLALRLAFLPVLLLGPLEERQAQLVDHFVILAEVELAVDHRLRPHLQHAAEVLLGRLQMPLLAVD
jgi:hypothetical protein